MNIKKLWLNINLFVCPLLFIHIGDKSCKMGTFSSLRESPGENDLSPEIHLQHNLVHYFIIIILLLLLFKFHKEYHHSQWNCA